MDIGDRVGEQQTSDFAVMGFAELDVVVGRPIEADEPACVTLRIAQVVQPSDNLELPFGSTAPSSNRALAALTAFSSASNSMTRRLAASNGSAS